MSESETTSDQDDVSFIRTDDMVCLQCSETGERVCLAAEGFGNRHCFLESIANRNYPPEMPSCVFVIEQALSVRALQEMVTAESGDIANNSKQHSQNDMPLINEETAGEQQASDGANDEEGGLKADQVASSSSAASGGAASATASGLGGGNRTLLYGHAVLLRHLHSGMYLATLSICSSSDKLAFDVGLKPLKEIGESCWWTVHPGSKQRSEGEKVRFGDDLILVSVATERYLHYTTTDSPVIPIPMASASASASAVTGLNQIGRQAIVNASFHSTHWSIAPFGTGLSRTKNVGYVFGGQVLRLLHGGDECLTISASTTSVAAAPMSPSDLVSQQQQQQPQNQSLDNSNQQMRPPTSSFGQKQPPQTIDVIYEGGAVMSQARSLWRLDLIRTKWSGGFVQYSNALRIRHITTGKYLGVHENQLCLLSKVDATIERTAFCLRLNKDDNKSNKAGDSGDDKDEEVIGTPMLKYGDSSFFVHHIDSQRWLSYRSYETKKRGIGRVEEKQAILSAEGKMDDCLEFCRSQEEEAKTARVIRKCDALFSKFIKILDHVQWVASTQKQQQQQGQQHGGRLSFADQGDSGGSDGGPPSSSRLARKRPSIAANSLAASAMAATINSGLAPLFLGGSSELADQAAQRHRVDFSLEQAEIEQQQQKQLQQQSAANGEFCLFSYASQIEMSKCLEDLIDYFAQPEEGCDHEQEQTILRALRNRQDLFQEEGILNLILDAIDKINLIQAQGLLVLLLGEESSSTWEAITGYFYQLLAAIIKDNHTNCAQFAQAHRLNWLFSRLSSQQASEGTGMLDVLHCVLVDSPEALNMLRESHIKVLISLLEKHGRDPKVLNVLCSLCVSNGVAIRSSQNTITNHLLPDRNLLLQTRLVDHVTSMRPNVYVARVDGSAMYHRWYYEVVVDHIEMINNLSPHLRVGWANTKGYLPYPGSGSHWGANGVGDDFFSYAFDGQYLWSAGRPTLVRIPPNSTMTRQEVMTNQHVDYKNQHQLLLDSYANQQKDFVMQQQQNQLTTTQQQQQQQPANICDGLTSMANIDSFTQSPYLRLQKNDVIGCMLDLSVPSIQFTINGKQIFGFFKNFNVLNGGLFHPVVSFSAKVSCRLLFGSNQGELRYRPPVGFSPLVEVLLPQQEILVEPCFSFGDLAKQVLSGPQQTADSVPQQVMDMIFIPRVIDTSQISDQLGPTLEPLRDCLADNMHELWCMSRIEDDWIYGEELDEEQRTHPFICPYSMLPSMGKKYKLDLATQILKTILSLGYKIQSATNTNSSGAQNRVKIYRLPNTPYMQSNGYKPAPLDLSQSELTPSMNRLVELLAENIHNIWAAEKINMKWTYRRRDVTSDLLMMQQQEHDGMGFAQSVSAIDGRSPHLLPYKFVSPEIKLKNRQSALESVFTILAYNYHLEPPSGGPRTSPIPVANPNSLAVDGSGLMTLELDGGEDTTKSPSPSGHEQQQPAATIPAAAALGIHSSMQEFTGHETILNNAMQVGMRHYRAEKTYAVHSGRWYYEVEIQSVGFIQVGWASLSFRSDRPHLGCDDQSWAFDCHAGRKAHNGNYETFGQVGKPGQIIGCMLDLNDKTISYSLNGKLLLDSIGNEIAFSLSDWNFNLQQLQQFDSSSANPPLHFNGLVPAISLGPNERVRLCFGQDVEQLRYFTDYGLQEGYQPFCVNMHKPITLWYNRREPNFLNLDELDPRQVNIDVTRIPPGSDTPPALKIAYKQFESQERATWEYVRLSLPVTINAELMDEADKIARMQEIQAQQLRLAYSQISELESQRAQAMAGGPHSILRHPARLEQHMLQSGFSLNDVKGLQRTYATPGSAAVAAAAAQQDASMHQQVGAASHSDGTQIAQPASQRRFNLLKTRSVDTDDQDHQGQQKAPSLAVPSFTEAEQLMTASQRQQQQESQRQQQMASQAGSLENLSKQESATGFKSRGSRSTFKSIFGSMKSGGGGGRGPGRSQSLSRARRAGTTATGAEQEHHHQQQLLTVPKIFIQNGGQQATNAATTGSLSDNRSNSLSRTRNLSRSGSDLSITSGFAGHEHHPSGGAATGPGSRIGGNLVRRLSRVGLGPSKQSSATTGASSSSGGAHDHLGAGSSVRSLSATASPPPFDLSQVDQATLDLIDEYYYGVRIFPGQEPSHVLCGWVTSQFKHESLSSLQDIQYTQIIQSTSLVTGQAEICERRECYLLNAGQLYKEMHPIASTGNQHSQAGAGTSSSGAATPTDLLGDPQGASGNANLNTNAAGGGISSRSTNRGMLIGCHVDASTGLLTFTVDGKLTKYKFQLESQTKLYPGIFFQATTGDCLQFELSRTPLTLPLSAAILSLTPKHVQGQCPPRLKVQTLQTSQWSRVPNVNLRPNALKLSDTRGWSMLADNPLAMLVVHVPEDDRCLDVLELIEHERLLKFHSNTLILYGALCAQGNHKVAHIICSHVDQRQLLYAINSDYLSGDLRRGFADLLIALHLEFHAYGRHLTQNEFIVPITQELCQLYQDSSSVTTTNEQLTHSFSHIECVSIRTDMNMSPIGFDLSAIESSNNATQQSSNVNIIKMLSTPYFPLAILKKLVFQALDEAVYKGNLPIRDLPGGSNANLFVPILKLADKLLLVGCVTNQELAWLLSLIDPDTFERPKLNQNVDSLFETPAFAGLSFLAQGSNSPSTLWKPTILSLANQQNNEQVSEVSPPDVLTDQSIAGGGDSRASNSNKLANSKGLLQMSKLDERVKLAICYILHHLLDNQLRHRIESIMAFSVNFVGQLQTDQRRRYNEIKNSDLPSHLTARKTREFRCSPREQMRYILNFKNNSDSDDVNASPSSDQLRTTLKGMHSSMMKQIKIIIECDKSLSSAHDPPFDLDTKNTRLSPQALLSQRAQRDSASSSVGKLMRIMQLVKMNLLSSNSTIEAHMREQSAQLASLMGQAHSSGGSSLVGGHTELKFIKDIVRTVVKWAEESTIENKQLIRQMFHLLLRCYNGVGELIDALNNSYVIGEKSKQDVIDLLQVLSKVRALLAVQMGPAEEEVMRDCLWTLVNNVVFFQHPDLIRILRVHENVMHVMMNTLNKRSRQSSASAGNANPAMQDQQQHQQTAGALQQQQQQQSQQQAQAAGRPRTQSIQGIEQQQQLQVADCEQEGDISKMVVSCCRFLCFFCRSSAKNQKAMFEHLGFILENSNILLSRPSLRGATPLDVACSSLMENHELVLALRESYLEKIAIYLSRCGLQSNQELIDKGYPDVGWDPVEGERYLDFLRFCVWVNGESVEENSNLVIRLLIRRPECLGPALRGEGPGLFAAIKDAISMADSIHADQLNLMRNQLISSNKQQQQQQQQQHQQQRTGSFSSQKQHHRLQDGVADSNSQQAAAAAAAAAASGGDSYEDEINIGSAILNFYCALVDLLGRCAPDLQTIGQGKHESIRARSILKSLVPIQDLKQAISLKFALVNPIWSQVGENEQAFGTTASSFMPNHKQSLVLFLERVYGIEDQATFFSLLEEAFLPDMRAATMLEKPATLLSSGGDQSMSSQQQQQQQSGSGDPADPDSGDADESENEMTLALNRYLGNSAIPLLIREAHFFKNGENYANLLEPTLHTVYQLSKVKILTKGQRESVSDFLIALTREMQPHQLLKLLRKLTVDVAVLNESTTVALKLLTLHYERCSKYYGFGSGTAAKDEGASSGGSSAVPGAGSPAGGVQASAGGGGGSGGGGPSGDSGKASSASSNVSGTATEEERRLTMVLFTNIFDSLSLMDYDPELFENSLPCLNALACALPPDYSLTEARDFSTQSQQTGANRTQFTQRNAMKNSSRGATNVAQQQHTQQQPDLGGGCGPYIPQPVDTYHLDLDPDLHQLAKRFSEHYHDAWASRKLDRDWQYGEQYNFKNKIHPRLRPYALLTQYEKNRYIEPIEEAMKALVAMGWSIKRRDEQAGGAASQLRPASRAASTLSTVEAPPVGNNYELIQNYNPQPVDTSNLSLSRELQLLAERSAENAHDLWARKQMEDWAHKLRLNSQEPLRAPILLHPLMVPYDLLTDKEKRKNRDRSQELLKYMLFEGYRVFRQDSDSAAAAANATMSAMNRGRINSRAEDPSSAFAIASLAQSPANLEALNKRRFAYSILNKLLGYTDIVMVKLELLKPSANFGRRSSFKQSDRDVKFFSKVVLPLIERYFTAHRDFFVQYYASTSSKSGGNAPDRDGAQNNAGSAVAGANETSGPSRLVEATENSPTPLLVTQIGCATLKEKEMLVTLFCKLAAILRNKLIVIGPDAKILVRCLQVLARSIDARTLSEQSQDFVRSSLLTFFSKTAQDLSQCVYNLKLSRYNEVRGATMRTSSSLYHIHLAVLPTLTALFDHLASSESGKYLLLDEVQVNCQKILYNLYLLGTQIRLAKTHQFSRRELERHRHSYGNCLAAFAAAFPVAFLEPDLARFNRFSSINTKRHQPIGLKQQQQQQAHQSPKLQSADSQSSARKQSQHQIMAPESMPNLPKLEELLRVIAAFVDRSAKAQRDSASGSNPTGAGSSAPGPNGDSSVGLSDPSSKQSIALSNQQGSGGKASEIGGVTGSSITNLSSNVNSASHQQSVGASASASSPSSVLGGAIAHDNAHSSAFDPNNSSVLPADNDSSIIEVIVPMLCSYLQFWYSQGQEGPALCRQFGAGNGCTKVVSRHLNELLANIMNLIKLQVGIDKGQASMWLVTIAAHASQIINDNSEETNNLLSNSFMPLSTKLSQRAESIYHREEAMRGYLKSAAEDTTAIEEKIQEEFHILVRDIYAFYPLLIKYSDYRKSAWLKQSSLQQTRQQLQLTGSSQHQARSIASASNQQQQQLPSSSAPKQSASSMGDEFEEQQSHPEQLLFHQVATVFDIWSNSQYFRREEQNFISQHEIDNMALIMQASNRPGRTQFQKSDPTQGSTGGRKKNKRRGHGQEKREIASPLLVVALKRLLPIGMNLFGGRERELVQLVKERLLKKESHGKIEELVRIQLTQPNKLDLTDEFCWQHYLYSRLGNNQHPTASTLQRSDGHQQSGAILQHQASVATPSSTNGDPRSPGSVDARIVARIVDMARVFHGLHIIDHPNLQQKLGKRSCVSTQRRRVVIACFRMTSLHSLPRHRAINFFLRSYCETWLLEENFGQEKLIEDLTQTFEQAEQSSGQAGELSHVPRNDPLSQLIMTLSRQATTEHGSSTASGGVADFDSPGGGGMGKSGVDQLYLHFAVIFRMSCGGEEEDEEEDGDGESGNGNGGGNDDDYAQKEGADYDPGQSRSGGGGNEFEAGSEQGENEDDGEGDERDNEAENADSDPTGTIHEQEMEKQRLLFQQSRLSVRGVAEMILLYISSYSRGLQHPTAAAGSASSGAGASASGGSGGGGGGGGASSASGSASAADQTSMILSTLKLGISILRGGNVDVQRRMLRHLKEKKDVNFFISIQALMNSCSVLNLDAFERNQKAEALGVRSEGTTTEKNMYDAEFTCKLFRFFQLLCEGHNLEFQNYLRTQAGNTTTVNVVISTVDYLLRLQESTMDFYWHYSSKELIDASGTENFIKAFKIAKQVFSTLTESIQGPCPQNQQALAHSRLWHAVGGFLFLFAHMQDKLSRNSSQLNLLIELLDLQKEMVIMMLSMLEGNVVNGTIGKQMVDTLVESSGNVEMILKFFDMFLKLPKLTSATNFQEYDKTGSGWISASDLRKAMEQQKIYTPEEINYLLSCCEPNHNSLIDYREFVDRFHQPAKDISFNLAVLLTNLTEHITNEPRLQRFLDSASSVLKYFEPYLGRIEIMGSAGRIERVYFEIKESTLDQWAKPQIQESKRAFFFSIVTECDGKEKLEAFVNFCEDTIFEMQHATKILGETEVEPPTRAEKYPFDASAAGASGPGSTEADSPDLPGSLTATSGSSDLSGKNSGGNQWAALTTRGLLHIWTLLFMFAQQLRPMRIRRRLAIIRQMSYPQLAWVSFKLIFSTITRIIKFNFNTIYTLLKFIFQIMTDDSSLMVPGHQQQTQQSYQRTRKISQLSASRQQQMRIEIDSEAEEQQLKLQGQQVGPTKGIGDQVQPPVNQGTSGRATLTTATPITSPATGFQVARSEIVMQPTIMVASVADLSTSSQVGKNNNILQAEVMQLDQQKPLLANETLSGATIAQNDKSRLLEKEVEPETSDPILRELIEADEFVGRVGGVGLKSRKKRRGIGAKLAQLASYKEKVVSFLARNFYTIKLLALVTAFIINFILLFFKVAVWTAEADEALASIQRDAQTITMSGRLAIQVKALLADASDHLPSGQYGTRRSQLDEIQKRLDKARAAYDEALTKPNLMIDDDLDDDDDQDYDYEDDVKMRSRKNKSQRRMKKSQFDETVVAPVEVKHQQETEYEREYERQPKHDGDDGESDGDSDHNDNDHNGHDDDDEEESTELVEYVVMDEKYYYFQQVLTFMAWVHSIFSLCMLIAYYHLKVPLVIFKREKEIARKLEFDGIYIVEDQDNEESAWTQWQASWDKLVISAPSFPVNYWDKFVKKRVREKYREQYGYEALTKLLGMNHSSKQQQSPDESSGWTSFLYSLATSIPFGRSLASFIKLDFRYQIWKAGITLTDQSFLYQLFYLIFSLAGHYNYFFFAAHLLDVAFGFKKLRTILHSVTHNGQQLVLTVMLLTIVVYIYTVIAFNFFRKFYVTGEDDAMDRKCHSMFTCFVYHIYQGVRAGGGIGDVIEPPDGDDYEFFRIAFDITFFFSVIVILLAIIQGLIIDAFGELRGQLLAVAEDMESNCFICGIGKDALDKIPRGFETHVQKEHNLANYMFFLMHLINKPNTDYTGQETYVWELYERRCWNFFPVGECFRTQSEEEGADVRPAND